MDKKHQHAEAFCFMKYRGYHPRKQCEVWIWNSRDGVTPMSFYDEKLGLEFTHTDMRQDEYNPDYKPLKGDLVWITHNEETARKTAEKHLQVMREHLTNPRLKEINEHAFLAYTMAVDAPEEHIKMMMNEVIARAQPCLVVVKEDWK